MNEQSGRVQCPFLRFGMMFYILKSYFYRFNLLLFLPIKNIFENLILLIYVFLRIVLLFGCCCCLFALAVGI